MGIDLARKPPSQEEIDEAIRLREEGLTIEGVAERLGRSTFWVYKHTGKMETFGKTEHLSAKKLVANENKRLAKIRKKLREIGCIPVVFGGMNTV